MPLSALNYILALMTRRYHDMQSLRPVYPVAYSARIIEFCINLLYRCGYFCRYNDLNRRWEII